MNSLGEFARGSLHPSVAPVWHREAVTVSSRLIRDVGKPITQQSPISSYQLEHVSISFSEKQVTKLKEFLDSTGDFCSMFDAVEASIWPDRTRAIDSCSYTPVLGPAIAKGYYENRVFPVTNRDIQLTFYQCSSIMPIGVVGFTPTPKKGIHLITWGVSEADIPCLVDRMANLS
ncbi:hypothetical protein IFM89_025519 [Coptis chinensis]|uniref:Uncharacterized protein n=1 Tax=Coptis chinensis TaxID=261450 RepID=A0A835H5D1_9MAGN|nr:hypothetical protein IFM89_025519 [Coptis chinensis]